MLFNQFFWPPLSHQFLFLSSSQCQAQQSCCQCSCHHLLPSSLPCCNCAIESNHCNFYHQHCHCQLLLLFFILSSSLPMHAVPVLWMHAVAATYSLCMRCPGIAAKSQCCLHFHFVFCVGRGSSSLSIFSLIVVPSLLLILFHTVVVIKPQTTE